MTPDETTEAVRMALDERPLVAWIVSDDEYPEHGSVLVYATTREQARSLGAQAEICEEYTDACARRHKAADKHAGTKARIENSRHVLRSLGWREEDEHECLSCGLYANGLTEFAVDAAGMCVACRPTPKQGADDAGR